MDWKGIDTLKDSVVEIRSIQKHPRNVRRGNVNVLMTSLRKFGQMSPLLVQKSSGHIVKGNHTWEAAFNLNWTHIAANVEDMDDDTAYAYLLADNRASDLADYDKEALARNLQTLADSGKLQDSLWTADDMDDVVSSIGVLETIAQEFKGDFSDDPKTRAERQERELTRIAPKMREIPVVITLDQHRIFMEQIKVLQKAWFTGGAIETILLAVAKEAEAHGWVETPIQNAPSAGEGTAPDAGTPAPPVPAPAPDLAPLPVEVAPPAPTRHATFLEVAADVRRTLIALKMDPIKRSMVFGVLEACAPMQQEYKTDRDRIARAAVVEFRSAIMANLMDGQLNLQNVLDLIDDTVAKESVTSFAAGEVLRAASWNDK